jgi:hypothetical protein
MNDRISNRLHGLPPDALGDKTPACPEDQAIAAFYEARLPAAEHASVVRHLADCAYCRTRLGMLGRLEESGEDETVPEDWLVNARQQSTTAGTGRRLRVPAWAVAAVVVLALGLMLNQGLFLDTDPAIRAPAINQHQADTRELRSLGSDELMPRILEPASGAVIPTGSVDISWTPVEGVLFYDLLVMSDIGEVLLSERVQGTSWQSDGALVLEPGSEYFLRVVARLADGRTAASEHVDIRMDDIEVGGD